MPVFLNAANFYYRTLLYKKHKKAYNSFVKYLIKEGKKTENKDKKNIITSPPVGRSEPQRVRISPRSTYPRVHGAYANKETP